MNGNLRAEKRVHRVNTLLKDAGIQKGNNGREVKMIFIAPDEGHKIHQEIEAFLQKTNEEGVTHVS